MAMRVIIDGYNLLGQSGMGGDESFFTPELEERREAVIEQLSAYKRIKRVKVSIIFDGTATGKLSRSRENRKGVEIIFSRGGEEADDILREVSRELGGGVTIVTSDGAVRGSCEASGSVVIPSDEFLGLLDMALYMESKGLEEGDEEYSEGGTKKKGNPRRAPKKDRKKKSRIKKL